MGRRKRGISPTQAKTAPAEPDPAGPGSTAEAIRQLEQQALHLIQAGQPEAAEPIYRRLLADGHASESSLANLAVVCGLAERWQEVIDLCRTLLATNPYRGEIHGNLGVALWNSGDQQAALASLRQAAQLQPDSPQAHANLGKLLRQLQQWGAAECCFAQALQLNPGDPECLRELAICLRSQGQLEEARIRLQQAHSAAPQCTQTLGELAISHYEGGDLEAAIEAFQRYLAAHPDDVGFRNNLGIAYVETGRIEEACQQFRQAIALEPNNPEPHYSLAMARLYQPSGYGEGWQKYAWRRHRVHDPILPAIQPTSEEWDGSPLQPGDTLLAISEQGLGDTLQFIRYIPYLRQRDGLHISVCAPSRLHGLIQASGIDPQPLSPQQAAAMAHGRWISLMSLPGRLGVSPDNVLCEAPYLSVPPERVELWRQRLAAEPRPLIGLNWQGDPSHENTVARGRSLPLEAMAPIAEACPGSLVSLQKRHGVEQLERCSFRDRFVGCQAQVDAALDFLDTAAIIRCCDLVITSDTAVAHLAGGLGSPTWLLLKQVPEWRWGLEGARSFWYPSLRLFRQRRRGDWAELMTRVADTLRRCLAAPRAPEAGEPARPAARPGRAILAPISLGELIDKITILRIKVQRLDGASLHNARQELEALEATLSQLQLALDPALVDELSCVNQELWSIEDRIREQERRQDFGEVFIALARSVYQQNDHRAAIKKQINLRYGSALVEEKAYKPY